MARDTRVLRQASYARADNTGARQKQQQETSQSKVTTGGAAPYTHINPQNVENPLWGFRFWRPLWERNFMSFHTVLRTHHVRIFICCEGHSRSPESRCMWRATRARACPHPACLCGSVAMLAWQCDRAVAHPVSQYDVSGPWVGSARR